MMVLRKIFFVSVVVIVFLGITESRKTSWGGGSRSSSRGSSSWGFGSRSKPSGSSRLPTSQSSSRDTPKVSTTNFLQSEAGRPSLPKNSNSPYRPSNSQPTVFNKPSAPPSSGVAYDRKQQSSPTDTFHKSSAPVSHSDNAYSRQPASNPLFSSSSGNQPYKPTVNQPPYPSVPNHPHPNTGIGSSSFPSHSYPSSGPIHPQSYPTSHSSFPLGGGSYHPYSNSPPVHPQSYPSSYSSYPNQPFGHSSYSAPPSYVNSAPIIPGKTIVVMPESRRSSSGPGLGSIIAGAAVAGATGAVANNVVNRLFTPSSGNIHTYPSAPAPGTPTSSVTNNYYYGDSQGGASGSPSVPANPNVPAGSGPVTINIQNPGPGVQSNPSPVANPSNDGINTAGPSGSPPSNTNNPPGQSTNGIATKNPSETQNVPPPNEVGISDDDIMKLTEELFSLQDTNLYDNVEVNVQKSGNPKTGNVTDEATEPLLKLKPELDGNPTVTALRALYDNYERDGTKKESINSERRSEENHFLDIVANSSITNKMLNWLSDKKLIESNEFEQRDLLRRMWFTVFEDSSSGFERIFLSEKFGDSGIIGMQNWLYFGHLESRNEVNYLGYVDHLNLSGKGILLKLNYETAGFTMQNATIFIGTNPELEIALYTVCFHARPNNWCPVSLGGAKFFILTHMFRSYGKDLIDLGFPSF